MVHLKCSFILWSIAANVIIQMPCTKQPLSFGQNCSLTCHCLENVCDADTEGVGCSSGSCSPGYTGFPACQKPCDSGTFGVNCSSRCNCEPINICSPTNGNCLAPNKCSRFNYGPGCQGIRAYSLVAPSVHTDCANIIISWSGVSKTNYSGSPNIARYVVLYRSTEMNELDQINPPINVHSSSEYNYTFVPTSRKTKFIFHIRPDFYVSVPPGSYIETGVPTPPSPPFASECSGITGFAVKASGRKVTSSWQPHPLPVVYSVQINFTHVFLGDCLNVTGVNGSVYTSNSEIQKLKTTDTLNYWSRYNVEAYGLTLAGVSTISTFTTLETEIGVPTGAPTNLHLISPANVTEASLNWELPMCEERQGPFKSYVVNLEPNTDEVEMQYSSDSQTRKPPLHIIGLSPQTMYLLRVAFENAAGIGPVAEITFKTQSQGDVTGIRALKQWNNEVFVTWLTPDTNHDHGTLLGFEIEYWPQSDVLNHTKSVRISSDETQYWIRNLTAGTTYKMQIFSLYSKTRVGSGLVSFETVPQPSGSSWISLQLLDRSSSTIEVTWTVNGNSLPVETNYEVTVTLLRSLLPVTPHFSTITRLVSDDGIRKLIFTDLQPASEYHITISEQGIESTHIKGAGLDVWTLSVPFASSLRLKIGDLGIASEGNDSVAVNFPDIKGYDGGPLNGFYIAVVENVDFNTMPVVNSYDIRHFASHGQSATLISNGRIVFHSLTWPSEPILIGSGIVESEASHIQTRMFDPVSLENPPLKPNTTYVFYAVIQSIVDQWTEEMVADTMVLRTWNPTKSGLMVVEQNRGPSAVLIGGILGALLIGIAFCLLGWLFYCCCVGRSPYGKCGSYAVKTLSCQNYSGSICKKNIDECAYLLPDSYAWWSVPLDFREPRYLIIDPEKGPSSTLVGTWSKKDLADTFAREFASIPLGFKYVHNRGELKENRTKNRNQAVLPYDHNRVVLKRPMDSVETDYINASFVDGYLRRRAYITAQSPFDTPTACDFWLMVFQRNVSQIVMLTNLVEDGSLKCCQYWPDPTPRIGTKHNSSTDIQPSSSTHQFGDLMVQASDRVGYAHFTVRQFDVSELSTGNIRHVVQYHFHSWASPDDYGMICKTQLMDAHVPDSNTSCSVVCVDEVENGLKEKLFVNGHSSSASSAPFDRLAFIEFYYRVKTASRPEDGPVVVHCGTGLSRTGLYIAFDTLLQQATHERVVSVARLCGSLNKARANMFSSTQNYALLYDLLFEALLAGHSIVDLDVLSTYRVLNQKNMKLGRSFQWEQWSVLHHYTPLPDPDTDLRVAMSAGNVKRNRYAKELDLLPAERWRPHLSSRPSEPDYGGYINAVFLDGTALRDDVILTQTPMSTTVDDFWQLVDEEKVTCIVDMEPFGYGIKNAIRYWPLRTGELNHEPLFEGSSDEERDRVDTLLDAEDAAAARGPWWPFVGGYLQVCQVGPLVPVLLGPSVGKRGSSHGIYRRRLLLRHTSQSNSSNSYSNPEEKPKRREVLIFHFAGDWNTAAQVPESRVSIVRLIEGIRLERGTGPLLIHCLDGATRSGLLAVCHVLAERMTRDHYVDLFHVVKAVKIRRRAVINSPEQLRFVYRLLAQWIKQTLSEPLAEWTTRHMGDSSGEWQWPQLVGHLPPHTRAGVFSKSQLPALVADHSSGEITRAGGEAPGDRQSHGMLNASNSTEPSCSANTTSACTFYYYFQDELLNQRSTYSLNSKLNTQIDAAGDLNQMGSWSTVALNRAQY